MSGLYVYILASPSRALYVGISRSLVRRVDQHQNGPGHNYVRRHRIDRLVYFERIAPAIDAIRREKQIKRWTRMKRVDLIESVNPDWQDLAKSTLAGRLS